MIAMDTAARVETTGQELTRLLAVAVEAFTAAARVTQRPVKRGADGYLEADKSADPQRLNWSEFVCAALAGAAANMGGSRELLADRPPAIEDQHVKALLAHTLGSKDEDIACHRTEPVHVTLHMLAILSDLARELAQADVLGTDIRRLEAHLHMVGLDRARTEPAAVDGAYQDSIAKRILLPIGEDMKTYLLRSNMLCPCPITVHIDLSCERSGTRFGGAADSFTEKLIREAAEESARPWLVDRWSEIQAVPVSARTAG
ncbi:Helix-turn-helix protein [Mycobacteroides abscessus subsp. abscessus]|nr:Helix-turn-helix protein [Mycobacteroides abscessus subsp. abscessus]SIA69874.1 Helix-turn-helix protein [Mycobacteroides abscessus subsp. abscessus]